MRLFVTEANIQKIATEAYGHGFSEGQTTGFNKGLVQGKQEANQAATDLYAAREEAAANTIINLRSDIDALQKKVQELSAAPAPAAAPSDSKLLTAVLALYTAAWWSPDRPCDAIALWSDVREAAGIAPGTGPASVAVNDEHTLIGVWDDTEENETSATTIEGVVEGYETRLPSPGNDFGYLTVDGEIDAVKSLQAEEESCQDQQSVATSQPPSPTNLEQSPVSSKSTNDFLSSLSSPSLLTSDTQPTPTTKKKSQHNKPRKPRKPSQRKKRPTRN